MAGATLALWTAVPAFAQAPPPKEPAAKTEARPAEKSAAEKQADTEKVIGLLRQDVRAQKADIVSKTMALDATQAAAFWPLYKAYEGELQKLGDERLNVIADFAEHFDSINDAKAKALLERSFVVEDQRLAVQKKYKDEMLKVLPGRTVARFFQVESRLNALISLEISSQIPLVN